MLFCARLVRDARTRTHCGSPESVASFFFCSRRAREKFVSSRTPVGPKSFPRTPISRCLSRLDKTPSLAGPLSARLIVRLRQKARPGVDQRANWSVNRSQLANRGCRERMSSSGSSGLRTARRTGPREKRSKEPREPSERRRQSVEIRGKEVKPRPRASPGRLNARCNEWKCQMLGRFSATGNVGRLRTWTPDTWIRFNYFRGGDARIKVEERERERDGSFAGGFKKRAVVRLPVKFY